MRTCCAPGIDIDANGMQYFILHIPRDIFSGGRKVTGAVFPPAFDNINNRLARLIRNYLLAKAAAAAALRGPHPLRKAAFHSPSFHLSRRNFSAEKKS